MAAKSMTLTGARSTEASTATPSSLTPSSMQIDSPTSCCNHLEDGFSRFCQGRNSLQPCQDFARSDQELNEEYEFIFRHSPTKTGSMTLYLLPCPFIRAWKAYVAGNPMRPPPFESASFEKRHLSELLENGDAVGVSLMQYIVFRRKYGGAGLVRVLNYAALPGTEPKVFEVPHKCCGAGCKGAAVGCWPCEARKIAYEAVMFKKRAQRSQIPEEHADEIHELAKFIGVELMDQNTFLGFLKSHQLGQLQSLASCLDKPQQCLEENVSEQLRSALSRRRHDVLQILKAPTPFGPQSEMSQLIGAAQKALHIHSVENIRSLAIAQQETTSTLKRLTTATPLNASSPWKVPRLRDVVTIDDVMQS